MKVIAKGWKVLLAVLLIMAALPVFFLGYLREKRTLRRSRAR